MDGDTRYSIGDLARRTGLSVRTIRFSSDRGLLPPTSRSPAGYRRYGLDALARLDLVRTLRALGVDLATIGRVLDRELSVPEVAAAHAKALDAQIHTLRLRRAVLRAVARRGSSPEEMELMHNLARLSDAERRRIIHQFIDEAFGDLDANPDMVAMLRSAMPELSDDPTPSRSTPGSSWPNWSRTRTSRRASAGRPNTRRPSRPAWSWPIWSAATPRPSARPTRSSTTRAPDTHMSTDGSVQPRSRPAQANIASYLWTGWK